MGGSSCKPSDLLGIRKKKELLRKKKEQLLQNILGDIFQLQLCFENYSTWYKGEALRLLDLIERRIREFEDGETRKELEAAFLNEVNILRLRIGINRIERWDKVLNLMREQCFQQTG